jgi:CPA2 family monovalent cation:H+ antiporter-2
VLVVALGLALGSAVIFGVSMALGAFLAGMVVGQSEFSARAASEALPMRDAFAVLFFVSIGMLFDPMHLVRAPLLTAATVAIVVVGKPIGALLVVLLLGHGARIGLRVSVALAQVGEFSFILAMLADQLKLLPAGATDSLVAASIVSITINPLLYRGVRRMEHALGKSRFHHILEPRASTALSGPTPEVRLPDSGPRAVVVGYGPVGETVTRLLAAHGVAPTVIELNIDTVRRLQSEGMHALYGDANQRDVLKQAGLADALALILSVPGSDDSAELIRLARELNPKLHVVVRSTFHSQARALCSAGADEAFSGEAEVAMAMIDAILTREGATPEEMDLERKRARTELYRVGEPG